MQITTEEGTEVSDSYIKQNKHQGHSASKKSGSNFTQSHAGFSAF